MGTSVFDIETMGCDTPIALGFFDGENYREFLKVSDDCDVVWEFLDFLQIDFPGIKLYAHNAANMDNLFVLQTLHKHKQKVKFVAGLGRLVWVEPNITFEDSFLVIPRSLRACCEAFDVDRKLHWDHSTTKNIWEMKTDLDSFRAYLKRDCTSLSQVLDSFCKLLLQEFGITPSMTMSLTAVKAFDKRFYPVRKIDSNEHVEQFIRSATYGGRNEVYTRFGKGVYFYDVKGMYVSCYDFPVPIGKMRWTTPNIDKGSLAEAVVRVPEALITPLPYHYTMPGTSIERLLFPWGTIKGWWDIVDLRTAVENGCDIKILRQLECDEAPVLKEFGEKVNELRKTDNQELSRVWKAFGLRLTGKFGQHRLGNEVAHTSEIEDQTGWTTIDASEVYLERTVDRNGSLSPYIKPAVNMRIRAVARRRHLGFLLQASKQGTVYYCDNDSIVASTTMPTGEDIGTLQLLDHATEAYFIRSKFYGYEDDKGNFRQWTSGYHDFKLYKTDFDKLLKCKDAELTNKFSGLGGWKKILEATDRIKVDRRRSIRYQREFTNRILDGNITRPIRITDGDGLPS